MKSCRAAVATAVGMVLGTAMSARTAIVVAAIRASRETAGSARLETTASGLRLRQNLVNLFFQVSEMIGDFFQLVADRTVAWFVFTHFFLLERQNHR